MLFYFDYTIIHLSCHSFIFLFLLFFVLYLCAQLALYWWKRNEVAVTYAHAYLILCPKEETQETASA